MSALFHLCLCGRITTVWLIKMNIQFHHVTKTIHGNRVIDDVSMELCSGTVVGLRGINGSGKTMLLRLLAGLIYPSSGTITVDDAVLGKTISSVESTGLLIENPAFLDD